MDGSGSASFCAPMMTRYALSTRQVQERVTKAASVAACYANPAKASFSPDEGHRLLAMYTTQLTNAWQESSMIRVSLWFRSGVKCCSYPYPIAL